METVRDTKEFVELEEPHFDDELTIVTAQPVIPLEEIAQEQTRKRRILLAGAFALSILLGAGTALLAIRIKRQAPQPVAVQTDAEQVVTEQEPDIQGGDTPEVATNVEVEPVEAAENELESVEKPKKVVSSESNKKQRSATRPQPVRKPVVEKDKGQEPARMVDQWEERRARRVLRREKRERRQRQELFRIGEIFEGSRRRTDPN